MLQCLDYLEHIDIYHDRIRVSHVKDAEFNPTGRQGVYGGYQSWVNRAGSFRSTGDGQVDFVSIFSERHRGGRDEPESGRRDAPAVPFDERRDEMSIRGGRFVDGAGLERPLLPR